MPLIVVVGGQYGGEGKGAISAYLARQDSIDTLVKTGGPNSSHSFGIDGKRVRLRMMPCGANLGPSAVYFPAGCLIHPETLFSEVEALNFNGIIVVDRQAGIVDGDHILAEKSDPQYDITGSTLTGTGAAVAARARRKLQLAKDDSRLNQYIGDVSSRVVDDLSCGKKVLVEGSQAFGLSNYHGEYPFVTSRDSTVAAFLSQVGVGPRYLSETVLVLKCFPTRNKSGLGRLPGEFPLDEERLLAALHEVGGGDYTGGDSMRRVGLFDIELALAATQANTPSYIALTGLDRLQALLEHPTIGLHYRSVADFRLELHERLKVPVALEGWGPNVEDVRDFRDRASSGAKDAPPTP